MSDQGVIFPQTVVKEKYALFKHEFLEFLFSELVDMRSVFENDLDSMLIYTAISRFYLRDERAGLSPGCDEFDSRGFSATRISAQTKIPRETVRRKLHELQGRGLIEKGPRDEWRIAVKDGFPVIRTEYQHEWRREMERVVKFVKALKDHV
ncbi:MAG: hypothetical protein ACR652_02790 [Methylocystis sp.]|uniref:hypothetical protein n=1 Tax=Methylocystis sp. TaxID=1911079 RepID=UPI003DA34ADB